MRMLINDRILITLLELIKSRIYYRYFFKVFLKLSYKNNIV